VLQKGISILICQVKNWSESYWNPSENTCAFRGA